MAHLSMDLRHEPCPPRELLVFLQQQLACLFIEGTAFAESKIGLAQQLLSQGKQPARELRSGAPRHRGNPWVDGSRCTAVDAQQAERAIGYLSGLGSMRRQRMTSKMWRSPTSGFQSRLRTLTHMSPSAETLG